jgi:hypothetical protein
MHSPIHNQPMKRQLISIAACLIPLALFAGEANTAPQESANMKSIFNGKDLSGWDGDPTFWSVKEGVIRGESTAENPAKTNTFLIWKDGTTKDFELRLSYRCNAANNSGIQYRSKHFTGTNEKHQWVVRGYQHELRNETMFPNVSGFIFDEGGKRKRICLAGEKASWEKDGKQVHETLIEQAEFEKLFKLDDWNDVVIIAEGNRIKHYLNNRLILDFTDNHPDLTLLEGVLALQLHGGNPMWVEFKNIRIREL